MFKDEAYVCATECNYQATHCIDCGCWIHINCVGFYETEYVLEVCSNELFVGIVTLRNNLTTDHFMQKYHTDQPT